MDKGYTAGDGACWLAHDYSGAAWREESRAVRCMLMSDAEESEERNATASVWLQINVISRKKRQDQKIEERNRNSKKNKYQILNTKKIVRSSIECDKMLPNTRRSTSITLHSFDFVATIHHNRTLRKMIVERNWRTKPVGFTFIPRVSKIIRQIFDRASTFELERRRCKERGRTSPGLLNHPSVKRRTNVSGWETQIVNFAWPDGEPL